MTDPIDYRRLPGLTLAPTRRRTLYAGPDHLLSVRTSLFIQEYRRFYYRDIQAIVMTEHASPWIFYLFAIAAFLVLMLVVLDYSSHPFWAVLSGIGSLVAFAIGMRMPNCYCLLRTATTVQRLPSLGRKRAARRAIRQLQILIEEAQKDLAATAPPPLA